MKNTIVYLIGHYGVGKLTVARAICAQSGARLFDNHLVNNVLISLFRKDGGTPLPPRIWDYIANIRSEVVDAIAEIGERDESYVLTNALKEEDEMDRATFHKIVDLASRRDATFVPVILSCSEKMHAIRVASPDREIRLKATNVERALATRRTKPVLEVEHPNLLKLDNSSLSPDDAAATIIAHAERCGCEPPSGPGKVGKLGVHAGSKWRSMMMVRSSPC